MVYEIILITGCTVRLYRKGLQKTIYYNSQNN